MQIRSQRGTGGVKKAVTEIQGVEGSARHAHADQVQKYKGQECGGW